MKTKNIKKNLKAMMENCWDSEERLNHLASFMTELAAGTDNDWLWKMIFNTEGRADDLALEASNCDDDFNVEYFTKVKVNNDADSDDAVASVTLSMRMEFALYPYTMNGKTRYDIYSAGGELVCDNDTKGYKSIKKVKKKLWEAYWEE